MNDLKKAQSTIDNRNIKNIEAETVNKITAAQVHEDVKTGPPFLPRFCELSVKAAFLRQLWISRRPYQRVLPAEARDCICPRDRHFSGDRAANASSVPPGKCVVSGLN
jgi:hypothetical protein